MSSYKDIGIVIHKGKKQNDNYLKKLPNKKIITTQDLTLIGAIFPIKESTMLFAIDLQFRNISF